jgi:fructoselysine-6-P-deglycase FrlB-like protein
MLAGAAIAASLAGATLDPEALSAFIGACDEAVADIGAAAARLSALARLLAVGSGVDATTASEQALKIEEGAWIPTAYLQLETLLHGHLPGADAQSGLVVFLLDPLSFGERAARTRQALAAAAAIGITTLLVTSEQAAAELREAADEAVVLPAAGEHGRLGALLAGAVALQRLTLALAAEHGTNPDLLRRDDERYRSAALLVAHKLKPFAPSP